MLKRPALKKIQFKASAPEIEDEARLYLAAESPMNGLANEAGFLLAADHLQFKTGLPADTLHQAPIVTYLPGRRGSHGTIGTDTMVIHAVAKMSKNSRRARDRVVVQQPA